MILDWVPAHFPRDAWALARFDGTALYEHADPRRGAHPDWGTLVFNFGRHEVRNFLVASALFWAREGHADGIRVDAVASMLYLDYSRKAGEWIPNEHGGREDLEAVEFLKEYNEVLYAREPGIISAAEESTAWPGVSRPTYVGGLGFGFKWNMGWMHDTLGYFQQDPINRRYHHHQLTFSLMYAFSENFILPLSHDEVVHGKGSLIDKMPGDRWQKMANLRCLYAYMWAHPGKKLLFMGCEIAQWREWSHERSLDWHLLAERDHAGVQRLVRDLNGVYRDTPALWQVDDSPDGFRWLEANDADRNVVAFARLGATERRGAGLRLQPLARPPRGLPRRAAPLGPLARGAQHRRRGVRRDEHRQHGRRRGRGACRGTSRPTRPSSRCRRSACCGSCPRAARALPGLGDQAGHDAAVGAAVDAPDLDRLAVAQARDAVHARRRDPRRRVDRHGDLAPVARGHEPVEGGDQGGHLRRLAAPALGGVGGARGAVEVAVQRVVALLGIGPDRQVQAHATRPLRRGAEQRDARRDAPALVEHDGLHRVGGRAGRHRVLAGGHDHAAPRHDRRQRPVDLDVARGHERPGALDALGARGRHCAHRGVPRRGGVGLRGRADRQGQHAQEGRQHTHNADGGRRSGRAPHPAPTLFVHGTGRGHRHHGRVERDRRGDRAPAGARAGRRASCSSPGARTGCAALAARARRARDLGRRRPHRRRRAARGSRATCDEHHGRLDLLVNNAGAGLARDASPTAAGRTSARTMEVNFDAQVRLTEALLPLLRASAPSAIVNVASTAGRVARARHRRLLGEQVRARRLVGRAVGRGARRTASTSGSCCPGFIATEGFPQAELTGQAVTRWVVSTPEKAAEAIVEAGLGRRPERYVPRPYALAAALRVVAPRLVRRVLGGGAAAVMTTRTGADERG